MSDHEFQAFAEDYLARFVAAIQSLDREALEQIVRVLAEARLAGRTVFIAGNGGSAAIANHAECDVTKGTHTAHAQPLVSRSLASNAAVMTAIANDHGFEWVFARQVELYAKAGDVLMIVSSSGASANVVHACKVAKERGLVTVALVGFKGGALKTAADYVLHVPVENYGIVEDAHQVVFHLVTQYLRRMKTP